MARCAPTLEEQTRLDGTAQNVRFLGHRADVPELLAAADVFVCPSLREGACASALEAMSAGKPILSTPVGMARDLIPDSDSGIIVDPRSSEALVTGLSQLLSRRDEWPQMGLRARAVVEESAEVRIVADRLSPTSTPQLCRERRSRTAQRGSRGPPRFWPPTARVRATPRAELAYAVRPLAIQPLH